MKKLRDLFLLLNISTAFIAASSEKSMSNEELIGLVAKLDSLTLVTKEPVPMPPLVWKLCERPAGLKDKDHAELVKNPNAHYKVYVTTPGAAAMTDDKTAFPLGTVILKQKLEKKDAATPVLYTGMLKREEGYNKGCGDWEFFLVSGDGKTITERGKIQSCMECHILYPGSDFVTKKYK